MSDLSLPDVDANNPLEEADAVVADVFLPQADHGFVRAIGAASDLTDQEPLYAASGAVIATGLLMGDERTLRAGTRVLASHLLATAFRGVIKEMIDRTRPVPAAESGEYELTEGRRRESDFSSFPSGHTAGAVAVARALGRHYPGSYHAWFGLAGLASVVQVVRSKHYMTDVIAGAAIGLLAEEAVHRLLCRAERI